jgi:hypothetical protein
MLVIPLQTRPEAFFGASNVFVLKVSRDGVERLSELLWNYLAPDEETPPHRVGTGPYPQSVFYASAATYNLSNSCNTHGLRRRCAFQLAHDNVWHCISGSGARPASTALGAGNKLAE